jgi:eukaryotic-like serine/threonine-protein kinase
MIALIFGASEMLVQEQEIILAELVNYPSILPGLAATPRAVPHIQAALQKHPLTSFQLSYLNARRTSELLVGPYVLVDKIGEGGMGEVYKARHALLGRFVAIKLIRENKLKSRTASKRFIREVRATAKLNHPRIVRAIDADNHGDRYYLVMEYVEGVDLARLVFEQGPVSVSDAVDVAFQVALALQSMKENGVIHRDLKPTNVIKETHTGVIKVLDLGLSRVAEGFEDGNHFTVLTMAGAIIGTPDFMSPEQAVNPTATDIRSDIYSLGCVLYFILTGEMPYTGGTPVSKMTRQMNEPFPDIRRLRPSIPENLFTVLSKLTQKDPAYRYQSPSELIADLAIIKNSPLSDLTPLHSTVDKIPTANTRPLTPLGSASSEFRAFGSAPAPETSSEGISTWRLVLLLVGFGLLVVLGIWASLYLINRKQQPLSLASERGFFEALDEYPRLRDRVREMKGQEIPQLRKDVIIHAELNLGTSRGNDFFRLLKRFRSFDADLPRPEPDDKHSLLLGDLHRLHSRPISTLALSPDGKTIAIADSSSSISLVNLDDSKQQKLTISNGKFENTQFSPDGTKILAWSQSYHSNDNESQALYVWEVATRKQILKLLPKAGVATISAGFSPDSKYVVTAHRDHVGIWDIENSSEVLTLTDEKFEWFSSVAFSADGTKVIAGGGYKPLRIWDRQSRLLSYKSDQSTVKILAHPHKNLVASFDSDNCLRIRSTDKGALVKTLYKLDGDSSLTALSWSPDGNLLLAATTTRKLICLDASTWKEVWKVDHNSNPLTGIAVSAVKSLVISGNDQGRMQHWDLNSGKEIEPATLTGKITHVAFNRYEPSIQVFDENSAYAKLSILTLTGKVSKTTSPISIHTIRNDGGIAFGRGRAWQNMMYSPEKNSTEETLDWHGWGQLSYTGQRLLYVNYDKKSVLNCVDMFSRKVIQTFTSTDQEFGALGISPDGKFAAAMRGNDLMLWNVDQGNLIRSVNLHDPNVTCIQFTPDSVRLLVGGPGKLIHSVPVQPLPNNPTQFARSTVFNEHNSNVTQIAVSYDSDLFATATKEGEILVRSTSGTSRPKRYIAPYAVTALAFSHDGRVLAAGLINGTTAIYRLSN